MEIKKGLDLWKSYNLYKSQNEELREHLKKIYKLGFELLLILHDKNIKLDEVNAFRKAIEEVKANVII